MFAIHLHKHTQIFSGLWRWYLPNVYLPERCTAVVATWSSVLPKSATAHQTVTHWLWRGRSWCCRGFASAQHRKFCLFTKPDKWKWASSLQSRRPGGTFANILSQAVYLSCQSRSWSSWTIIILYGWNFKFICKILRTLRSDIPKASACLAVERCGDVVTNMSHCCDGLWCLYAARSTRRFPF